MPTTVHIPPPLLDALDRRAEALGVSRNRLIVTAIERELRGGGGWPPGFFDWVADVDDEARAAVDDLEAAMGRRRSSKRPPKL